MTATHRRIIPEGGHPAGFGEAPRIENPHVSRANRPIARPAEVVVSGQLRDAAALQPELRPDPVNPATVPASVPRVPALLVETETGPMWHYEIGIATHHAAGEYELPKIINLHGRTLLLVDAEAA